MFRFIIVIVIAIIFFSCKSTSTTTSTTKTEDLNKVRLLFYNVENLFDTINDPVTNDEDFLPEGRNNWNSYRYNQKLNNIAKVVVNLNEFDVPALIGLCEIENRSVLEDLVTKTPLQKFKYNIIHHESPDERGIDVALLYRPDLFTPIYDEALTVSFPFDTIEKTRDILYISGMIGKDTLHVFVNHWPSRRGGEEASAPKRNYAAEVLKKKLDSIFSINSNAKVIITGDFNDYPTNESISKVLNAKGDTAALRAPDLYNFMYPISKKGEGTYKYQGEWNTLDQIIVSTGLLNANNKLTTTTTAGQVFRADWLLEEDRRNPGVIPFRTYAGPNYIGGYSDHLPVLLDMWYRK